MPRRHPLTTTRAWLFRCLLTLLTLAGLGLWQTAHCADHTLHHDQAAVVAAATSSTARAPDPAQLAGPDTAADGCHVAAVTSGPAWAPAAAATAPPADTLGPRNADVASRPIAQVVRLCHPLTEIGISRT